jgi:hypothetical protein
MVWGMFLNRTYKVSWKIITNRDFYVIDLGLLRCCRIIYRDATLLLETVNPLRTVIQLVDLFKVIIVYNWLIASDELEYQPDFQNQIEN